MIEDLPHYLPNMSHRQIQEIAMKERMFGILPLMAVEQHGPHLPVGVDAILNEAWLKVAVKQLEQKGVGFVVGAPIVVGKSNEHNSFPGTLSLSIESLRNVIISHLEQFLEWGFERVLLFNTHGGNIALCEQICSNLMADGEMEILHMHWYYVPEEVSDQAKQYDIHAGELESSLMYAVAPDLCDPSKAVACWPKKGGKWVDYLGKPVALGWKTEDISENGVIGDAGIASKEKGVKWLEDGAKVLDERMSEVCKEFFFEG